MKTEGKDQNTECLDERRRRKAAATGEIDFSGKKALVMNRQIAVTIKEGVREQRGEVTVSHVSDRDRNCDEPGYNITYVVLWSDIPGWERL